MKTIRARILFVLSIASLVPLIAMFFVVGFFTRSALQNSEEAKITETGRELSQHVTVIMDGAKNDLESLKTNPILLDSTSSAAEKIVEMRRLVAAYDSYTDLSLYNPEGYLIDSTTEAVPTWREYTDWFKEAVEKQENRISHPGKVLGKPGLHLTVYLPLVRGNEVDGVVVARLSFSRVSDMIRNVKLGEEGFVYLTDQMANLIIDGRNPDATEGEIKKSNLNQFLTQPLGNHVTKDGTEYLYSAQLLAKNETGVDQAWTLIAFKPMSEVSAIANNTQLLLLASLAGSILVVCLIGFKFAGVLSKPLAEASEAA